MNVYKPSNYQFATQGAVSSSSHISRLNYDTISSQEKYGNMLYYGSNYNGYNIKIKKGKGYPMLSSPSFPPRNTQTSCGGDFVCNTVKKVVHL